MYLKKGDSTGNKALSQEVTKGENCIYPSAYSIECWMSVSSQMQNYQMLLFLEESCTILETGGNRRKEFRNDSLSILKHFDGCTLPFVSALLLSTLPVRLFKDGRVSLTLRLFYTSLFTSVMPPVFFPVTWFPSTKFVLPLNSN